MYTMIVVDDEQEIRRGFCSYFPWAELGFEVVADFSSAQQADEFLKGCRVDVLVTDIRMRGMSGLELIESMRSRGDTSRVVVISGYRDFEYARHAMRLGVKHYIVKPMKFAQISEVFTAIRQELDAQGQKGGSEAGLTAEAPKNDIVHRVKTYVHQHYEDATLEQAAKSVGMNPYYLSSYFHQQTGEKFIDYVFRARMKEAARLLLRSELRINEVASLVGYTTANSFSRAFRQYHGMTPKEYRLEHGRDDA